jgi:hypothetical protein
MTKALALAAFGVAPELASLSALNRLPLLVGLPLVLARLKHLYGVSGHDRRDGVFVDELRMPVAPQQQAEIVEPGDDSLELDAVDEEDRERDFILPDEIQKRILQILRTL